MEIHSNLHFWTSVQYLHFWVSLPALSCLSSPDICLATHRGNSSMSWTSQVTPGIFSCLPASSSGSLYRSCFHWFFCHGKDQTLSDSKPLFDINVPYCCFMLDRFSNHKRDLHRWVHLKTQLTVDLRILTGWRNLAKLSEHC